MSPPLYDTEAPRHRKPETNNWLLHKCSEDEYLEDQDEDDVVGDDEDDDDDGDLDDENLALLNDDKAENEEHDAPNCSEEANYHTLEITITTWSA